MTREAQVAWWQGLDPKRRERWNALLAAMTDQERNEFHRERAEAKSAFRWPEDTIAGDHERAQAEALAHWQWRRRLSERVQVEPVTAAECLSERRDAA